MRNYQINRAGAQVQTGQRVVLLDLLTDAHEVTLGQNSTKWRQVGDILEDVGPRVEGITVHTKLQSRTANFSFKLRGSWSLDGVTWNTFAGELTPAIATDGAAISNEYTTKTDFGRHIRFELGTADTAAIEHGIVSVMVALRFYQGA